MPNRRSEVLDPQAKARVNEILQDVALEDGDMRRFQVVPDESLAKAFKYLSSMKPWANDAYILRELIYGEVLRLAALVKEEGRSSDLPLYFRQIDDRMAALEERQAALEQAYIDAN